MRGRSSPPTITSCEAGPGGPAVADVRSVLAGARGPEAGLGAHVLVIEGERLLAGPGRGVRLRPGPGQEEGDGHGEEGGLVVREDRLRIAEDGHPHRLGEEDE